MIVSGNTEFKIYYPMQNFVFCVGFFEGSPKSQPVFCSHPTLFCIFYNKITFKKRDNNMRSKNSLNEEKRDFSTPIQKFEFPTSTFSEESLYIHGAVPRQKPCRPVSFPIYQTATFENPGLAEECPFSYTRCANPTRSALEKTVALSEKGEYCFAFSSGLSAILAVFSTLSKGEHVVLSEDIYGGTYRLMNVIFKRFGIECTLADFTDIENVENACKSNTKLIFTETPTNPMARVADIKKCAEIAHNINAKLCIDNTFMTPYLQKPLTLGADIVVHSGTKYLCGHHDTSAGFVVTNNQELAIQIEYISKTEGTALSPFDSWLVMRGMKTLPIRIDRHEENAQKVFKWLKNNRNVEQVYYSGDSDNKGYDIMKKQAKGFGAVISFRLKFTSLVESVLTGGNTIIFAESLGGTESLITYPITQTHATTPDDLRRKIGIDEKLIRLSCGIEPYTDIISDLENTLGRNL